MDQSPKICPKCQQANFPIAEFCRHCGEAIYDLGTMSRGYSLTRLSGYLVDGLFWVFEELARWWELSQLNKAFKKLQQRRQQFMERMDEETGGELVDEADRAKLMSLTEEISQVSLRRDTLKRRSWAYTPEILFALVFLIFLGGLIWINPKAVPVGTSTPAISLSGSLAVFRQVSLPARTVLTSAAWHQRQLFVGGDFGLMVIDPTNGVASAVSGLPPDFFVHHLLDDGRRLLIAGYGGVFALENGSIVTVYDAKNLPAPLVNRVAVQGSGHLLGTVGMGVMQGRNGLATLILGTQGRTILAMEWFNDELWLLHERGLLKGDGTRFSPVVVPVLNDQFFTAMAVVGNELFISTTSGLLVAYKGQDGWIWSPVAGAPRGITDMLAAADQTLLLCAAEGIFRWRNRAFELVVPVSGQQTLAMGREFFASAGPGQAVLYQPAGVSAPPPVVSGAAPISAPAPIIPTVGTFQPDVPVPPVPAVTPPVAPVVPPTVTPPPAPAAAVAPSFPSASPAPAQPAPVPPVTVAAPPATDPFFGSASLPPGLIGALVTAMTWDGRSFWAGTLNDGIWRFSDGSWTHWNSAGGQLKDDQVVNLYSAHGKSYLYSWILGLVLLDGTTPRTIFPASAVQGLLSVVPGDQSFVYLLFKDGFIRRFKDDGPLEDVSRVPEDFFQSVHSLQILQGKPLVVVNDGVLSQDQTGRWITSFYDEDVKGRKPLFSALAADGRLIVALDDGRVFAWQQRRLQRLAALGTRPRSLSSAGSDVWLLTSTGIYRLENNGFATVPLPQTGPFLNHLMLPERQLMVVLGETGLRGFRL